MSANAEFSRDGAHFTVDVKRVTSDEWFARVFPPAPCATCDGTGIARQNETAPGRYTPVPCPSCSPGEEA